MFRPAGLLGAAASSILNFGPFSTLADGLLRAVIVLTLGCACAAARCSCRAGPGSARQCLPA
eukprot:3338542-Alexandrium_andersonii.AAC.1